MPRLARPPTRGETTTGIYGDRVLPRIVDRLCDVAPAHPLRARVCAGLHGRVLELGFGSGLNVAHYPDAVVEVAAVEPADLAWELAAPRLAATTTPVRRTGLDGRSIPLPDGSCDSALSTWTLCTVPDVAVVLAEVRRALRPGGTLHFVEHGLAPDEEVRRWQHRLDPLQRRLFGGCHLTRPIVDLLVVAGFTITELDVFYQEGTGRIWGADSLGVARAATTADRPPS